MVAFFKSLVYNTFSVSKSLTISGCGPAGRAPGLGDLSYLFGGFPSNPNIRCNTSTFSFCSFIKKGQSCGLTTVLTTTERISFLLQIQHPGVAQLVGRLIWVQDAGSSNLPTRTKSQNLQLQVLVFLCLLH